MFELIFSTISRYSSLVVVVYFAFAACFVPLLVARAFRNRPFAKKYPVWWWVTHWMIEGFVIEQAFVSAFEITMNPIWSGIIIILTGIASIMSVVEIVIPCKKSDSK